MRIRVSEDLEECRRLWMMNPPACLFDMWTVREAFALSFSRQPYFVVAEQGVTVSGLLPLSWIEENHCFGNFPGETWRGKTWLEQNKLWATGNKTIQALLAALPDAVHLRYMTSKPQYSNKEMLCEDEEGYLFYPGRYGYDSQRYWLEFSGKSRKQMAREMAALSGKGLSFRYDRLSDSAVMFRMNLESLWEHSYFKDPRFLGAFERLISRLHNNGMLRITTVLLGGKIAAVDVGAVWNNTYTVLAGATHQDFPGVAKLINFHHMDWACGKRFDSVDFLCGDFGWKKRFHLAVRPLYEIRLPAPEAPADAPAFQNLAYA
jgi:hypothetical protein